jgi:DNA-binding NarL/FixJ family response regulator
VRRLKEARRLPIHPVATYVGVWVTDSGLRTPIRSVVVDDDRDFRMLVRIWMERILPVRYEVVGEAGSGEECLDLVDRLNPDLVLLDLTMPRTNSYDLIEEMRAKHPDTDIVVLSGFDADRVEAQVLAKGAIGYLEKCANIAYLRESLDRMVGLPAV